MVGFSCSFWNCGNDSPPGVLLLLIIYFSKQGIRSSDEEIPMRTSSPAGAGRDGSGREMGDLVREVREWLVRMDQGPFRLGEAGQGAREVKVLVALSVAVEGGQGCDPHIVGIINGRINDLEDTGGG